MDSGLPGSTAPDPWPVDAQQCLKETAWRSAATAPVTTKASSLVLLFLLLRYIKLLFLLLLPFLLFQILSQLLME